MSKSKNLHICALVCNILIIVFAIVGAILSVIENNYSITKTLKYFTFLTSLISGVVSCVVLGFHIKSIIKNKDCCPSTAYILRFVSATMGLITFIMVMAVLVPTSKNPATLLTGGDLFLHILLPIVSVICFVLFEIEPKFRFCNCFIPLAVTVVYGIGIIIATGVIYAQQGADAAQSFAPYPFFKIFAGMKDYKPINIALLFLVLVGSFALSCLVWLLNRMVSSIIIGYEVNVDKNKADKYENNRVYHVSTYDRKLKNWKVKLATGEKAIKVFKTQKEAIDYATSLAKNTGGSIRVHSKLGRIRKD